MLGGQPAAIPMPFDQCVVPQGINGPVAIFITSDGQPLVNNVVDRATAQLVAGPTMTFVDTQPQMIGMLVNSGINSNSTSNSTSTASAVTSFTTQTISPAEAQSIIQAASATLTATASSSSSTPGSGDLSSPPSAVSINAWTTVTAVPSPAP
jgi:hypothetical protein